MNCFSPNRRVITFCIGLILALCALVTPSFAQTPPASTNPPPSDRFLVILDISAGMEKRAENTQRVIAHMFSSGLNGQLHRGDTVGMWTYNDSLHTGEFPLQRWTPQTARQIPSLAAQFAQNQRYSKRSSLSPVMAQLTNVIATSDRITIILVSDGSESLAGTPFDAQIAKAFRLNTDEQRRQAMPFVTVLRAVKGAFVSFKVNAPPWPIEFPSFPPEPIAKGTKPTNSPPVAVENPKPVTAVTTAEPKPAITETNKQLPIATNSPTVVESTPIHADIPSNPPPVAVTKTPPTTTNVTASQVVATEPAKANSPPAELPKSKPTKFLAPLPLLAGIGVALVGLAILCLAFLRRSRQPTRVSLITRSMNKDRK